MSIKQKGEASPEGRHWGRRAVAVMLAAGATGLVLHNRDGPDHRSEVSTQTTDSIPGGTTSQSIEGGTGQEKERSHREEINALAQNLVGRIANFNDQTPQWVLSEHNTARIEVRVPSQTPDGQEASFHLAAEVDLGPDGKPDETRPRQVQIAMEQGTGLDQNEPPLYKLELVKLPGDAPGGEWGLHSDGLAGTAAGHPDGTNQTIRVTTLENPVFDNGMGNGNYFEEQWRGEARRLANNVIDAAQAGAPVDPGLAALV